VTEVVTVPSEKTATAIGTVISFVSYTVVMTSVQPSTVTTLTVPGTTISSVVTVSPPTTSVAPAQVTTNAAANNGNGAAALAGVIALVAAFI
jgi:hypothetical protein